MATTVAILDELATAQRAQAGALGAMLRRAAVLVGVDPMTLVSSCFADEEFATYRRRFYGAQWDIEMATLATADDA